MNKYLIGGIAVVAVIAAFFVGQAYAPVKLGSYIPPVQSAGGFTASLTTSTAYTLACNPTNIDWVSTTAAATGTLAAATTTFAACPNLANPGTSVSGLIVNDSTNTVAYAVGAGVTVKCETSGVGTSTVSGGCTGTTFSILASTTIQYNAFFDGSSSTLVLTVGNNFK